MAGSNNRVRAKATVAAVLLLLTGALLGVAVDRHLMTPRADALQLTMDELSEHLDLAPAEETRMRALIDSIEPEVAAAAAHGTDSLQAAAARAHERIEAALRPASRQKFRDWIRAHHDELSERMHGDGGSARRGH